MSKPHRLRALLSCSDKSNLPSFSRALSSHNYTLFASAGTHLFLKNEGIDSISIADEFQLSPILDGRVKTLHPRIFAGLLAKEGDVADMEAMGYFNFDLLVANLYPFTAAKQKFADDATKLVEFIDVGGPAMLRAAAKSWSRILVVSSPQQYPDVINALHSGEIKETLRRKHAAAAIRLTSTYDAAIADWLDDGKDQQGMPNTQPVHLATEEASSPPAANASLAMLNNVIPLRYGENPQQSAAVYTSTQSAEWNEWLRFTQEINGSFDKHIGYNNLVDAQVARELTKNFTQPCCSIVKHATPCGVAATETTVGAWERAAAADPISRYGGVVAFNRKVEASLAKYLAKRFLEVLTAPAFTEEALVILSERHVRCITFPPALDPDAIEWRSFGSGLLGQQVMPPPSHAEKWISATPTLADTSLLADCTFAWNVVQWARSNAIVLASQQTTRGIGSGFTNRVDAAEYACLQMQRHHPNHDHPLVAASDAFFPFSDGLAPLEQAGVRAIVQPSGAKLQKNVVAEAEKKGIAVWLAPDRQFRH